MDSTRSTKRGVKSNQIHAFISDRRSTRRYRLRCSPSESKLQSRGPPRHGTGARAVSPSWELACRVPCTASYQRVEHLQIKPGIIRAIWYVKKKTDKYSTLLFLSNPVLCGRIKFCQSSVPVSLKICIFVCS